MQKFSVTVSSKNKKSYKLFLKFFQKHLKSNFYCIKKKCLKKKRKKVITLLSSPHVNKPAQEQFEIRNWEVQFVFHITQPFKFLIFIKKIRTALFPDVRFKLNTLCSEIKQKSLKKFFFNINNYNFTESTASRTEKKKFDLIDTKISNKKNMLLLKILELQGKAI